MPRLYKLAGYKAAPGSLDEASRTLKRRPFTPRDDRVRGEVQQRIHRGNSKLVRKSGAEAVFAVPVARCSNRARPIGIRIWESRADGQDHSECNAVYTSESLRNCFYVGFFGDFRQFAGLEEWVCGWLRMKVDKRVHKEVGIDRRGGRGKSGAGWIVVVVEEVSGESRESSGGELGVGERRVCGGFEVGQGYRERWLEEDPGGVVDQGREVTAGGQSVASSEDRLECEELADKEFQGLYEIVGGGPMVDKSESRDRQRVGDSGSVQRALARSAGYASQGKLVRAAGQLGLCGQRPQRLIGNNVRQIETCIRPRSYRLYGQKGFTSYVNSASSSLRPGTVVGPIGGSREVETTGCPCTRSRTTCAGPRQELCSRKYDEGTDHTETTDDDPERGAEVGRQRDELRWRFGRVGCVYSSGRGSSGRRYRNRQSRVGRRRQEERARG